ncbi:HNH endonuclease [Clostridium kluyveri]|uniref:HNH nuclease domain-containing protein n=1 Tax=Clostridium kluyveri TaxID=1534 RepID=A0A1L5FA90_CLOKL|nr:HNH endonuclease [Clostridium kluyveri]APM39938.1 hypothetical protein BS101_14965 [Clostridium kluyveri]
MNKFQISDDGVYVIGHTKKGEAFLFDSSDYSLLKKYNWSISKRGYVVTKIKRKETPMHKILLGDTKGYDVDHISGNKLNNCRSNLRICTHQQNMFNQRIRRNNTSGFIGVSLMKKINQYEAYVHFSGKKYHMGLYSNAVDAAIARDKGAIKLFGEYANLNFPLNEVNV